jgi:hypothetical protein
MIWQKNYFIAQYIHEEFKLNSIAIFGFKNAFILTDKFRHVELNITIDSFF